jgi:hypothetical protein
MKLIALLRRTGFNPYRARCDVEYGRCMCVEPAISFIWYNPLHNLPLQTVSSSISPASRQVLSKSLLAGQRAEITIIYNTVSLNERTTYMHHVSRESTIPKNQSRSRYYYLYTMSSILRPLVSAARTRCVCNPSAANGIARSFHATPSSRSI